ncbi:MAG: CocE/NonD family hydrolase [Chloroflexi bacterium]|nr:CocE/NonD family hydrolase [Chloroflexota bacterium]
MCAYQSSQHGYDVVMDEHVTVQARDSTGLATTLYFPGIRGERADGPFPALIERTPYDRKRLQLHLSGLFFARHGYVVALQDIRGRGDSGGEYHYLYNPHTEADDGYDAVEWLASQPWSNGQVGTFGGSHTGATQQALAVARPPHLVCQVIRDCAWNYFLKAQRHGGALTAMLQVPYPFHMALTSPEAQRDPALRRLLANCEAHMVDLLRQLPLRPGTTPLRFLPSYENWYTRASTLGHYDAYWRNPGGALSDYVDQYADVPVLFYTSWYGHHPWGNFMKFNALRKRLTSPIKLIVGVWTHGGHMLSTTHAGEVDFGLAAALGDVDSLRLQWFDRYMRNVPTPLSEGAPLQLFVMGGGDGRTNAEGRMQHGGYWRHADEWPLPETRFTPFYLHADGGLESSPASESEPASTYSYDPQAPVPTIGGNFQDPWPGTRGLGTGGAFDQRGRLELAFCEDTLPLAMRHDVLVFQTAPLDDSVEVIGPVIARLWVSSSAVDTDFTAKLLDVCPPNPDYPEGFHLNLCEAILRMRFRDGFEREELMQPGEVYAIEIELQPTANRFMPGHRIRLDISSSNFPLWDNNRNTGEPLGRERGSVVAHQTLYHDAAHPSHVVLPIIPAGAVPPTGAC